MKAACWCGTRTVRVDNVPDPQILNQGDIILRITSTAICGSDLHLYNGVVPTMQKGDILGHEFMGEVIEIGTAVRKIKVGDRVVIPFTISCGGCFFCKKQQFSLCDNSNPNAYMPEKVMGYSAAGLFGFSHMLGGFAGGQAEYARVPFADVGALVVPPELPDEKVLFLSDIFPTGYMAAENAQIQPGDVVAIWGCGPVGQFAIASSMMFGASQVVAIDSNPERLALARSQGATAISFNDEYIHGKLLELTGGRGPDSCIDAVGLEAHGTTVDALVDRAKTKLHLTMDHGHVIRQVINCCRKGGTVSMPGVYGGYVDKVPMGAAFNKGLTLKMGQTHVQRYMRPLLERIQRGDIDPSFVITHSVPLSEAPRAYEMFKHKTDGCIKVVLKPWASAN